MRRSMIALLALLLIAAVATTALGSTSGQAQPVGPLTATWAVENRQQFQTQWAQIRLGQITPVVTSVNPLITWTPTPFAFATLPFAPEPQWRVPPETIRDALVMTWAVLWDVLRDAVWYNE